MKRRQLSQWRVAPGSRNLERSLEGCNRREVGWMSLVVLSTSEPRSIPAKLQNLDGGRASRYVLGGLAWMLERYHRVEVHGLESLPRNRPLIFVAKHPRTWLYTETLLLLANALAKGGLLPFRMMLRSEARLDEPILSWLRSRVGGIPPTQEAALAALRQGESLLVFPGGRRELAGPRDAIQWRGRRGYARLAALTSTPVVPLAILGADWKHPLSVHLCGRTLLLPLLPLPVKLSYHFGAPMEPPPSADATRIASFSEGVAHATRQLLALSRARRGG
jgi:1-acyl-sn-glycerol-3-phosphate acyltransferase